MIDYENYNGIFTSSLEYKTCIYTVIYLTLNTFYSIPSLTTHITAVAGVFVVKYFLKIILFFILF